MITIGIDPGLTGAISIFKNGEFVHVEDMPVIEKLTGKGKMVDARELRAICECAEITTYWIEDVHAMPGQGVSSMFSFGRSLGVIEGVTAGQAINYVNPRKWKKHFGLSGKDKDAARTMAKLKFPDAAEHLTRKKDIGRADAILIGAYGVSQTTEQEAWRKVL
jgi:crossover junction endodeoxyribonuclease RuvC